MPFARVLDCRRNIAMRQPRALGVVALLALVLLTSCSRAAPTATASSGQTGKAAGGAVTFVSTPPFDPSVGAPLPNNRIVAVYGIASGSVVNGPASSLDMLNTFLPQLQQLGQQYAALDPTHPVKLGIDLVVNVFDLCATPLCSSWDAYNDIIQYIDFCQQHNLLLFFDLQLGIEPVEQAVVTPISPDPNDPRDSILTFLQKYPFTELALDTEFHFPNTPQGHADASAYNLGSMGASEVNWAINELAQVSLQHHVPRKVLVIHEWNSFVLPDKDKIQPNSNVSIVLQSDGFGGYDNKLGDYQEFVQQDLLEYGGYKLFFHYCDVHCSYDIDPNGVAQPQTPQQVMQLFPQPLFISYQ